MPPQIIRAVTALSREYLEDIVSVPQEQTPLGITVEQHIFDRFEIPNARTVWINVEGEQGKDANNSVYNKQFIARLITVRKELARIILFGDQNQSSIKGHGIDGFHRQFRMGLLKRLHITRFSHKLPSESNGICLDRSQKS